MTRACLKISIRTSSFLLFGFLGAAGCAHQPTSTTPTSTVVQDGPPVGGPQDLPAKKVAGASVAKQDLIDLQWPVESARLSRGYKPGKKRHRHLGLDLAAPKGTPVMAAHDGIVVYSGRSIHGYGRMVMLEARPIQVATLYAHLSKFNVKQGQHVKQGDIIGFIGRSGHATGYHLHFELRTRDGALDPMLFLPEVVGHHRLASVPNDESD